MNPTSDKRKALGRGLNTLLPAARGIQNFVAGAAAPQTHSADTVREIPVELIDRSPYQPRTHIDEAALNELAESIRVSGVIHGASSSGQTVYVEPLETIEQNNELVRLIEEEQA